MSARKKITLGTLPLMPNSGAAAVKSQIVPSLVEYHYAGEDWRCEKFDELVAEFETVTLEMLERFHQAAMVNGRRWTFVRRLFGMKPIIPPPSTDYEDLRVWSRDELCEKFQLSRPQLKAELDAVRGTWDGFLKASVSQESPRSNVQSPKSGQEPDAKPTFELNLADDPILKEYSFRVTFSNGEERDWFIGKVKDFEPVLREKIVSGVAHTACLTALRLHRLNYRLDTFDEKDVGSASYKAAFNFAKEVAEDYNKQVKQILDLCPSASQLAGKMALQPVVSTITQCLIEAATGETRLVDGLFTAAEVQVLARMSVQNPTPRYRMGWVVLMNSAKAGLFDPNWKPPFDDKFSKLLTDAWNTSFAAGAKESGMALPDLEQDGPGSEYADITTSENLK